MSSIWFYLAFLDICGRVALVALPIVALVNVVFFGKLRVTRQEYINP